MIVASVLALLPKWQVYNVKVCALFQLVHASQLLDLIHIELCNDGDVRISGGPTALIGQVEVCVNRTWGTVCGDAWSDRHAIVVCHQLGHSLNGKQLSV